MCGIIGYIGPRDVRPVLLDGLEKLEYRGYDSAGLAVLDGGRIDGVRAVGNLSHLRGALDERSEADAAVALAQRPEPALGIGHTRWATHGRVSEANAHPHTDTAGRIHIVVNGIVENYLTLKRRLIAGGAQFTSETDAEVIAHLIAAHDDGDLVAAVRAASSQLRGHYAFVAMSADEPGRLVAARRECPLVVGRGDGEQFIASAIPAFLEHTRMVQYVGDDELVAMTADDVEFLTAAGEPVEHELTEVEWDASAAEKQGHETFMMKEIHEQADVVADTLAGRVARGPGVDLGDLGPGIDDEVLRSARRITIVGCGTAYHAGLVGRHAIEQWARMPVEVDIASEYRYRDPAIGPDELVIGVSQSGETADTLAAMRSARALGARVLAITNVPDSQATREADGVLHTRAGLEIGVAATKTFVSQMVAMYLLALRLAELRGTLGPDELAAAIAELERLPHRVAEMLERRHAEVAAIAERHHDAGFFLYLGRNVGLPIALEGALKLKEISYVATDAYPAGEMKHGPIALLSPGTPVVVVATDSPVLGKALSNLQEVKARGAHVIAVAGDGNEEIAAHADDVIRVPSAHWMLSPLLAVIPLQLLAYHTARLRGLNVDQPRNLAKTVTVE
ncbi:MAG TPA: glutamine--fructose-6-phosphate transaminase (isomerizing) [Solirubrobacteraceae bacterium]|jgi:glutamine---fructose-6-phosphate transaminase (isomerizing)|nr:glutamine--fructose-6-phosphate transaminase (isomerizing) [Solirubrobacteraceae bacterium]